MYTHKEISLDDIAKRAPSVFTTEPASTVSDKYKFIPTIDFVKALMGHGWVPTNAKQTNSRLANGRDFAKHMIRFRHREHLEQNGTRLTMGETVPEVCLTNSHDAKSAFNLMYGMFRCVCENQLVVADSTLESIRVRHVGFDKSKVLDASYRVLENIPKLEQQVETFKSIELDASERQAFAESAFSLKFDDKDQAGFDAHRLLTLRRNADKEPSLWNTFNVIQENMIRGGLRTLKRNAETNRVSRNTTREVKSIDASNRLNKSLWQLTERMSELKTG